MKLKHTIKLNELFAHLYVLYILFSSYSVYMTVLPIGTLTQVGCLLFSLCIIVLFHDKAINKKIFFVPFIVSFMFVGATFFSTTDTVATALASLRFLFIFYSLYVLYKNKIEILRLTYNCLYYLMIYYFFCYVFFDVLFPDMGLSYIWDSIINVEGIETYRVFENRFYMYIRWISNSTLFGLELKRLSGFCWEAGMYQIYLNFILLYLLYFCKYEKNQKNKILFTIINIILCGSTMGYFLAIILVSTYYYMNKLNSRRLLTFLPAIFLALWGIQRIIIEKSTNAVYSYSHRTSEFLLIKDVFLNNNFFGNANIYENASNGLVRFLWAYGYVSVVSLMFLCICLLVNKNSIVTYKQKFSFICWLLLSLINEPIELFNFTFWMLSFILVDTLYTRRSIDRFFAEYYRYTT